MDVTQLTHASMMTHHIQAAAGHITAFDVSSNYQNVVFGDAPGCFHLYSSSAAGGGGSQENSIPAFNPYSHETQFADMVINILSYCCSLLSTRPV